MKVEFSSRLGLKNILNSLGTLSLMDAARQFRTVVLERVELMQLLEEGDFEVLQEKF